MNKIKISFPPVGYLFPILILVAEKMASKVSYVTGIAPPA